MQGLLRNDGQHDEIKQIYLSNLQLQTFILFTYGEMTKGEWMTPEEYIAKLEEENKKLNIKVASLEWEIKWLNSVIDKLHKEIEEQEAEWEWLFDEIDYRKREAKRLWWKPNK